MFKACQNKSKLVKENVQSHVNKANFVKVQSASHAKLSNILPTHT